MSSSTFCLLPNELLMEILGYLTLPDLALGLWPLRNKRIRSLCRDTTFCKDVFVDKSWDADTVASKVILMAAPNLKYLTFDVREFKRDESGAVYITDDDSIYPLMVLALERCPNLEYLQCRQMVPETVMSAIAKSSSLSRLILKWATNTIMTREDFPASSAFVSFAHSLRHLRCLDMEWGWCKRDFQQEEDESWAMAVADGCRSLERLRIPYVRMGERTFKYVLDHLKETLKDLKVNGVPLTNTAYRHLAQCRLLECFGIHDARNLGAEGLDIIVTVLSSTLKELAISGLWRSLTGYGFNQVFGGRVMSEVLVLCLRGSSFMNDSWLQLIGQAFPNLESLDVEHNSEVSINGVREVLRQCKKLKKLLLADTLVNWGAFQDLSSCYNLRLIRVDKDKFVRVAAVIMEQVPQSPHLRHLKVIKN